MATDPDTPEHFAEALHKPWHSPADDVATARFALAVGILVALAILSIAALAVLAVGRA